MNARHRVVVTGLGVLAPNAHGTEAFEAALREGKSGIQHHPHLAELNFGCQVGGIPAGVDALAERYFDAEDRMSMNQNMVYAAIAALDAWDDAALARIPADGEADVDTGAILGTGIGGIDTIAEKLVPKIDAGKVGRMGSAMVEQFMCSANSAKVAGLLGLGNHVSTSSSACNTGTEAIISAFYTVREGRAKRMLAGGSEGPSKYTWGGFDAMKVTNRTRNHAPTEASRPMSASAAGFVPGSGAGVLVLESLDSAERRGARVYAEVIGGFLSCGGHRSGGSMTAPSRGGVQRCIRGALDDAGVSPDRIGAINGHLTATFADPHEVANWQAALELPPDRLPLIHATKSLIGHALGAAGGIESVASVLELYRGFVHGSINCDDLHPALSSYAERIVRRTINVTDLQIIAKASFGFGDVNGCILFRKFCIID